MKPDKAKKVAARLLKCGHSKIWIHPEKLEDIKKAITKEDVRQLIAVGAIKYLKENQKSSTVRPGKRKRRKTGKGKKRGKAGARIKPKQRWMKNVRAQRRTLKELHKKKVKMKVPYRKAYSMIKGGFFKGKKYLEAFVTGEKK